MNGGKILLRGASAGAGKTFFLAKTYIRLLLSAYFSEESRGDVLKYRHVLAVTFTNKATAEMKERILKELDILSRTPEKSDYYADFLRDFSCGATDLQEAARKILRRILHDYGSFSVSTIDSFFQLVLRAFSREIGYFASYQVELDRNTIVAESVDRILDGLDQSQDNKELLDWLSRQAVWRVSNGMKFSSDAILLEAARQLTDTRYREALAEAGIDEDTLYDKARLDQLRQTCRDWNKRCKEEIRDAAIAAERERQIALSAVRTSRDVLENALEKLSSTRTGERDAVPTLTDNAYAKLFLPAGAVDTDAWFKKGDLNEYGGGRGLDALKDKMEALRTCYERNTRLIATLDVIASHIYGFGIAKRIRQEFEALMKEKNVLSLDETNNILKGLISDTATPFVYEKVGVRYENFLLDEFQDTSHVQWNNFRPLLQESLDNGHRNLVVGDPKQSIYRWRDSDASLMTRVLPEEFAAYIDNTNELDTNWRSREQIVRFNNDFFKKAAGKMDALLGEKDLLKAIYADVQQKPNHRKDGYVRLDLCAAEEGEENKKAAEIELEAVLDSVRTACEQGYSYGDITIVVRTGPVGAAVAGKLADAGIKVSTADSLLLSSSSIVRLALSLLASMDDPADKTRAYLASRYLQDWTAEDGTLSLSDQCEAIFRTLKEREPEAFQAQVPFVRCFMDLLTDFIAKWGNDLHAFVKYMDGREDKISSPESSDAVNIITIHKVKGLAAPYVIAPFIEKIELARVDAKEGEKVWCIPDLTGTPVEGQAYGVYQVKLTAKSAKASLFEKNYREERRQEYIDNLNVLYVAFTRPVDVLHIISQAPKEEETASFPAILKEYAEASMSKVGEGCYELGTLPVLQAKENGTGRVRILSQEDGFPSFRRGKRISLRQDAAEFFTAPQVSASASERINGTVIHDILAKVIVPEDLPASVRAAVLTGALEAGKEQATLDFLQRRIASAQGRGWFPAADSPLKIRNEATILMPDGKDCRTDRVLDDGGQVVIIDYKTGDKNSSYHRQMERYAEAYLAMGRTKVTTHLWYLKNDEVETRVFV